MLSLQVRNYSSHSGAYFPTFIFKWQIHDKEPQTFAGLMETGFWGSVVHVGWTFIPILDRICSDLT